MMNTEEHQDHALANIQTDQTRGLNQLPARSLHQETPRIARANWGFYTCAIAETDCQLPAFVSGMSGMGAMACSIWTGPYVSRQLVRVC